jgi:ArsR family transcriptional regulator
MASVRARSSRACARLAGVETCPHGSQNRTRSNCPTRRCILANISPLCLDDLQISCCAELARWFEICQSRGMSKQLVVLDAQTGRAHVQGPRRSDPTAAAVKDHLRRRREICVCDLTGGEFAVSGPTICHHIRVLREAGLIVGDRRGTWVYYRPVPGNLRQLAALLDVPVPAGR